MPSFSSLSTHYSSLFTSHCWDEKDGMWYAPLYDRTEPKVRGVSREVRVSEVNLVPSLPSSLIPLVPRHVAYRSGNGGTHVTGELLPFHFCRSCLSFLARDASHFQASHVRRARSSCHSLLHILRDVDRSLRATEGRRRSVSDDRPRLTRFLCHLVSPLPLVTGALLPHCVRPKGPPRYARFRRW